MDSKFTSAEYWKKNWFLVVTVVVAIILIIVFSGWFDGRTISPFTQLSGQENKCTNCPLTPVPCLLPTPPTPSPSPTPPTPSPSPTPSPPNYTDICNPQTANCHKLVFINHCNDTIYVGALGNAGMKPPVNGGWRLDPGIQNATTVYVPKNWGGRFWGRTGCNSDGVNCETGDCGSLQCGGKGGKPNVTVVEFTFDSGPNGNVDFYDVSNVDAYNMAIKVDPIPGTYTKRNPNNIYDCGAPNCVHKVDLTQCPTELQVKNNRGEIVACVSPCQKINTDQVCCRGQWGQPSTCNIADWPAPYNRYPSLVKNACPGAYSYPYDDPTSTFSCQSLSNTQLTGYTITFCSV